MSLKDKAAKIGFADLDTIPPSPPVTATEAPAVPGSAPATPVRARSGVAAISQSIGLQHRLQDLEAAVAKYEEGGAVVLLDPAKVRQSRFKNRHPSSFKTAQFSELKTEIETAGRNVQPIKVRRIPTGPDGLYEYEIVYGRRRHRACLELGMPVAAIVQDLSDVALFLEMERENRSREDLSAWEQGTTYLDALEQGLYSSQRQLSGALGLDHSNVAKAIKLASLPSDLVEAFPSPLDLQFRWGTDLADALSKDPERVLTTAAQLRSAEVKLPAKEVYARLIGVSETGGALTAQRQFSKAEKVVAVLARDVKGGFSLKIKAGALNEAREKRLVEFLERLF